MTFIAMQHGKEVSPPRTVTYEVQVAIKESTVKSTYHFATYLHTFLTHYLKVRCEEEPSDCLVLKKGGMFNYLLKSWETFKGRAP